MFFFAGPLIIHYIPNKRSTDIRIGTWNSRELSKPLNISGANYLCTLVLPTSLAFLIPNSGSCAQEQRVLANRTDPSRAHARFYGA